MVEEKFLLDTNSLMTPYQNFYPFDLAPGYWNQLQPILLKETVSVMDVVKSEVDKVDDDLKEWINSIEGLKVLDRRDRTIVTKYGEVLKYLQDNPCYNDKALRAWADGSAADPWLIATAAVKGYTLVTFEQSSGSLSEKNPSGKPKIPDVAKVFGVKCVNLYYFMRKMSIAWS